MRSDDVKRSTIQYHEDDRAQRLQNVYPHIDGQINISYVNSTSHVVAWHKHHLQTDYWVCIKGSFKVGLATPKKDGSYEVKFIYLSDKQFDMIEIPPEIYHGYKALEPGSILMYHLTHKYDPSDDIRAKVGDFNESWSTESK
jgi:dTDP-4-dehydrorhamnose 3,5-epimerase-like enzyme